MASMAEDFWNKVLKPLVDILGSAFKKAKNKSDGIEILEDGTMFFDKTKYDKDDIVEEMIKELDSEWILLESKNYYIVKHKSKIDKEQLKRMGIKIIG